MQMQQKKWTIKENKQHWYCNMRMFLNSKHWRGGREMYRWRMETLWGSETTLCDTIRMDPCQYIFFQAHRTYNRVNLNVNY